MGLSVSKLLSGLFGKKEMREFSQILTTAGQSIGTVRRRDMTETDRRIVMEMGRGKDKGAKRGVWRVVATDD